LGAGVSLSQDLNRSCLTRGHGRGEPLGPARCFFSGCFPVRQNGAPMLALVVKGVFGIWPCGDWPQATAIVQRMVYIASGPGNYGRDRTEPAHDDGLGGRSRSLTYLEPIPRRPALRHDGEADRLARRVPPPTSARYLSPIWWQLDGKRWFRFNHGDRICKKGPAVPATDRPAAKTAAERLPPRI